MKINCCLHSEGFDVEQAVETEGILCVFQCFHCEVPGQKDR